MTVAVDDGNDNAMLATSHASASADARANVTTSVVADACHDM